MNERYLSHFPQRNLLIGLQFLALAWMGCKYLSLPAHQVIVIGGLSTRTSLSLSIVNIWARKNGSFTSKLCPSLTEGFDYTAQLTLAAVASLAMENLQLFQSQEINQGSMFPWTPSISAAKERPRWAGQDRQFFFFYLVCWWISRELQHPL